MNSLRVLIYEDNSDAAKNWANRIREAYIGAEVHVADVDGFRELLELINGRRVAWRGSEGQMGIPLPHKADTSDVIVVDYDLIDYSETGDTTGNRLAYLLRCFTGCGFIIILNEYGPNTFDLNLGTPSGPDHFADLHIGAEQIGNPGLWNAHFYGYRPWHWPIVPIAVNQFEQCVIDVQKNIDSPILEFLDLRRLIHWLPQRAWEFLSGKQEIEEVTFRTFAESASGGVSIKDRLIPEQVARVAAARIVCLLNLIIIPEQNLLVDAPHLVSRFPSLIREGREDLTIWNKLCDPIDQGVEDLLSDDLKEHKFIKPHWLWRPAWYWPDVNKDENIDEVRDPWVSTEFDWVFCENISRFVPLEFTLDFRALVSPPFIRRYIFRNNSPSSESHIGKFEPGDPLDPSRAEYVPQAAFSS